MPKQDKEGGILPPSISLTAFAKKAGNPRFLIAASVFQTFAAIVILIISYLSFTPIDILI